MKISVNTKFGSINSKPVFEAFIKSLQNAGEKVLINNDDNCDVAVIWSILWQGRMQGNLGYISIKKETSNSFRSRWNKTKRNMENRN